MSCILANQKPEKRIPMAHLTSGQLGVIVGEDADAGVIVQRNSGCEDSESFVIIGGVIPCG